MSNGPLTAALRLVVILDVDAARGRDLAALARAAVSGGSTMLQVRGKHIGALALSNHVRSVLRGEDVRVPVVVNDRLDVAIATGAAGCHLGQDDLPIAEARGMVPPGFLLGGSAGTEDEARRCAAAGADYLGIGPVRATTTKGDAGDPIGVEGFRRILAAGGLPAVAIGGITTHDVPELLAAGAAGIAVTGAVLGARDTEAATRELWKAVQSRRLKVE
ncbi:MAG: thiamine phosphate synthase [Gemmatimonadales bacterium]